MASVGNLVGPSELSYCYVCFEWLQCILWLLPTFIPCYLLHCFHCMKQAYENFHIWWDEWNEPVRTFAELQL